MYKRCSLEQYVSIIPATHLINVICSDRSLIKHNSATLFFTQRCGQFLGNVINNEFAKLCREAQQGRFEEPPVTSIRVAWIENLRRRRFNPPYVTLLALRATSECRLHQQNLRLLFSFFQVKKLFKLTS